MIPTEWKFSISKNTKAQYDILKDLMSRSDVSEIICATDVQHMNETEVKTAISQLEKDKIPYSAVVNGDKSAVTVNKAHAPKIATLSRKQMHEQAEALRHEQRSKPKQKTKLFSEIIIAYCYFCDII